MYVHSRSLTAKWNRLPRSCSVSISVSDSNPTPGHSRARNKLVLRMSDVTPCVRHRARTRAMGDTARLRQTLPWLLSLVSSLLLLDNAFADCAPRFGPPGPLLTTIILPDDRRALESLLEE